MKTQYVVSVWSLYISYRGFSTPRPGRRVLSVALGPHHKPFESARTARVASVRAIGSERSTRIVARRAPCGAREDLGGKIWAVIYSR